MLKRRILVEEGQKKDPQADLTGSNAGTVDTKVLYISLFAMT
jgi:hypothetical protein